MQTDELQTIGDEAYRKRAAHEKRKNRSLQLLVLVIVAAVVWWLAGNVADNLEQRNIRSGFEFLKNAAGFEIGEAVLPFASSDSVARAFFIGLLNTLRVSFFAVISATVLGVVVGLMRLTAHPVIRMLGTAHVEFYRNIPLIIQLFAIYLLITELLPMSTEALHAGSWALLSKAGLQVAVPNQEMLSLLAALVAALLTLFLVRLYCRQTMTDLAANLVGLGAAVLMGIVIWVLFGFVGGWSKPVINGFAIEGGAALSPEFLALWLGRLALPPLASQYMNLTKNSSLAVVIGYPDLVAVGNSSINITGQALEIIVIIMAVYLCINLVISVLMNALNARVVGVSR